MTMLGNSLLAGDDGYNIQRSLRFRSSASASLSHGAFSTTNRQTFTISLWLKMGAISANQTIYDAEIDGNNQFSVIFNTNNVLDIYDYQGAYTLRLTTTQVFRDPSAWYHIVIAIDTTQATASNRAKLYVNGSQVSSFSTATYPSQNYNTMVNWSSTTNYRFGIVPANIYKFDGYLAEVNFIDGQALTPSSFGQTDAVTGVWTPKKYTGTYGTNGFYLPFSDNTSATTLAYDKSGNGNNWTPNNISTTAGATYDSMTDVPTLTSATAANYCVLNPLRYSTNGTLSSANLNYSNGANDNGAKAFATLGISTGKYYWESQWTGGSDSSRFLVGFGSSSTAVSSTALPFEIGANTLGASTGDVINVAIDFDAGKIWYGKNNVWISSGNPSTGANPYQTFTPNSYDFLYAALRIYAGADFTTSGVVNFGQRPFSYTPPTGFKALNTFNLPDPVIKKPNQYFDVALKTGTGAAVDIPMPSGFTPSLAWLKSRSNATNHLLTNDLTTNGYTLSSNSQTSEVSNPSLYYNGANIAMQPYSSDGGQNGQTYALWGWKRGATPGFDVVHYTGTGVNRTVVHSLGVAPSMIIIKCRNAGSTPWQTYHKSVGNTGALWLEQTASVNTNNSWWNNTSPDSSSFTLGTGSYANGNGNTHVAYVFAEVPGFSKFGSYTGNGSTDGPFVYCGFRPKYVMIKDASAANGWAVFDTSRNTYNVAGALLQPNASDAETNPYSGGPDILSNGFKTRGSSSNPTVNTNGDTYIFAAFAENPFKYSLAR